MSSENPQAAYFHPQEDTFKPRSKRKSYKYTDQEYTVEPSFAERYKANNNKSNINDFSFEDRTKKTQTPKIKNQQKEQQLSPAPIVDNQIDAKIKYRERTNAIQNMRQKIQARLKIVAPAQYKPSRNYAGTTTTINEEKPYNTPRNKEQQYTTTTPYRRIEQITNRYRRTEERKKNYSYLDEVDNSKKDKQAQEQENTRTYFNANYQTKQSPIRKYQSRPYHFQAEEVNSKTQQEKTQIDNKQQKQGRNRYRLQQQRKQTQNKEEERRQRQIRQSQRRQRVTKINVELDTRINQIKNKILDSPQKYYKQQDFTIHQYQQNENQVEQPTIAELAQKLSKLIDLDIILRKIRQSFEQYKNEKKWDTLRAELKSKNIYMQQKQLKQVLKISIHEKNPFGDKIEAFPLNGVKDLAKILAESEAVWNIQLDKVVSLDSLAAERFQMAFIDINRKGYITIEDLVCFVNVHSQKFYRSRDVAQLFRRFLEIEGKKLQKNISEGISYACFMNKVTR